MKSPKHVFISFKTQEREFAFRLKTALNNAGYKVWWQEEIQCAQEWHGEIDKAIQVAGAIVVLWSRQSMLSPWVRHEASQAIVKNVYAPVRIEIIEIDSPYNRLQATDIINWTGDINNPGFQNLLHRLHELMPPPVPAWRQATQFAWKQRGIIVLSVIAAVALLLLFRQSAVLNKQIEKQEETFRNVQKQSVALQSQGQALQSQSLTLQSQIKKQDELLENGRSQGKVLDKQLQQQQALSSTVQQQSEALQVQIQQQEQLGERQLSLSDRMDKSTEMAQNNLHLQQQSLNMLKSTVNATTSLNFPVSNGLLFSYTVRIYTEGVKQLWDERRNTPYVILKNWDTISAFVKNKVFKFPKGAYLKWDPYELFFYNISIGTGVTTLLKYKLANKENVITYNENQANTYKSWAAPKDIIFNPVEEYFEADYLASSGGVNSNPDEISNLASLFDSTIVQVLFRFAGKPAYDLPVNNTKNAIVKIKKIEVSLHQVRYGNNFQFATTPDNTAQVINPAVLLDLTNDQIAAQNVWRYGLLSFPLKRN